MGLKSWAARTFDPLGPRTGVVALPRRSYSLQQWINDSVMAYNGNVYGLSLTQTLAGNREPVDTSFGGTFRSNSVVFACMLNRMMIFSEARFQFRRLTNGATGDLFGTAALAPLERPWTNGTTSDLLSRAIQDVDLAGNNFYARRPGGKIKRLRPDWTDIILGTDERLSAADVDDLDEEFSIDAEIIGLVYWPGGRGRRREPEILLPGTFSHFIAVPDPVANYRGMSWLTPLAREVAADSAATTHKLKFFENGATPNMIVKFAEAMASQAFRDNAKAFRDDREGLAHAYETLLLGAGMDATVVGKDLQQIEFKVTQGAGETRIAAAAGLHPSLVGLSEGLAGSSLNAGNFGAARRITADRTFRPLWRNVSGSLAPLVEVPSGSELWYDERDIAFLREDAADQASILKERMLTIESGIRAGFKPDSIVAAVEADDLGLLEHTGLFSVQLQPPLPEAPAPSGGPPENGSAESGGTEA